MDPSTYYLDHKASTLKEFRQILKTAHPVLVESLGSEQTQQLTAEARQEFESLIPQLPYIGGKRPFTDFIIFTGMLLAMYRTSKAHGKSVEETGLMIFKIGKIVVHSTPAFLLRLFSPLNFSKRSLEKLKKAAEKSHTRTYAEDYVYNFVPGDGKTFDFGVDYLECASCKFLAKQGASEIAPYLCPMDIHYSNVLGWGLMRTQTLAEGADKCDFRFKKGGPTRVAVPAALQPLFREDELSFFI